MIISLWAYILYVVIGLCLNHLLFIKISGNKHINFSYAIFSFTVFTTFLILLLINGFNVDFQITKAYK